MTMWVYGLVSAGFSLAFLALPAPTWSQEAKKPSAQLAHGELLFRDNCAVCHKTDGSGGVQLGDVKSANLESPALESQYHHNNRLMARAILDGKDEGGGDLAPVMPRWRGRLTPAQVTEIVAYLQTLRVRE